MVIGVPRDTNTALRRSSLETTMNNLFTSELNQLAHMIRRENDLSWGESLRFAIRLVKINTSAVPFAMRSSSIFGNWTLKSQRALAGHFWALRIMYRQVGDLGRAKAFERISSQLYAASDEGVALNFKYALTTKGWGDAVLAELLDYFVCGALGTPFFTDHTDRVMDLLIRTNTNHTRVDLPYWIF